MTTERNPVFELYRSNCLFGLQVTQIMLENRQRLRQFQAQVAEQTVHASAKLAEAVAGTQDWASLSNLSAALIHQQAELAAGFWQEFFALAANNRITLLNGVREAVEDMQTRNTEAFQTGNGILPQNKIFEDIFKPFEPFMHTASAGNKSAGSKSTARHPRAKHGPNHAE